MTLGNCGRLGANVMKVLCFCYVGGHGGRDSEEVWLFCLIANFVRRPHALQHL